MRLAVIGLLYLFINLLVEIVASWANETWGLTTPKRVFLSLIALGVASFLAVVVEAGLQVPGVFLFHRFSYLVDLTHSRFREWASHFAPLHFGRRPYVAAVEVWAEGDRQDLVKMLYQALVRPGKEAARQILILGEPGCGKTTALERLALDLATYSSWRLGIRGPIPIFFRAGDYQIGMDLRSIVAFSIREPLVKSSTKRLLTSERGLDRLLGSNRMVVLCDGIDELSGERREQLLSLLNAVSKTAGPLKVSVVATCRTRQDPGNAVALYETFSILDLSDEAILSFLEIYMPKGGRETEEMFRNLVRDGFLEPGGLGRNPFWLKQLIDVGTHEALRARILAEASRKALLSELQKPRGSARSWKRPGGLSEEHLASECRRAMGILARAIDQGRTIPRDQARSVLAEHLEARARTLRLPGRLLPDHFLDLARDANLLQSSADPIGFAHRIVLEFHLALDLLLEKRSMTGELLSLYVENPERWQTLGLYAGLLSESDREELIEGIRSSPSPFALACAIAVYVENKQLKVQVVLADRLLAGLRDVFVNAEVLDNQLRTSLRELLIRGHGPAAFFLGRLFLDPQPQVRAHVCEILSFSESSEAVHLLVSAGLDDSEAEVGRAAVAALSRMGPRAVWPLLRLVATELPWEWRQLDRRRNRAIEVLGALGSGDAVNALLECEAGDQESAAAALAKCATHRQGRLLIALMLGEPPERVRAARALAAMGDPAALPFLGRAAVDEDSTVRQAALGAIDSLEAPATKAEALPEPSGDADLLVETPFEWLRSDRLSIVIPPPEPPELSTEALLELLFDGPEFEWIEAARALKERHEEAVAERLVQALSGPDPELWHPAAVALSGRDVPAKVRMTLRERVRQPQGGSEAAAALGAIGDPEDWEFLTASALASSQSRLAEERLLAVEIVGALLDSSRQRTPGGLELRRYVLRLLNDPDAAVRSAAEQLLFHLPLAWCYFLLPEALEAAGPQLSPGLSYLAGCCCDPLATLQLVRTLINGDEEARLAAAAALGMVGDPQALSAFRIVLQNPRISPRLQAAVRRAVALVAPEVRRQLEVLLHHRSTPPLVRAAAIDALSFAGSLSPFSIPLVLDLLSDPEPEVAHAAAIGLQDSADLVSPALPAALVSSSEAGRAYATLLFKILAGEAIDRRWLLEAAEPSERSSAGTLDKMSLLEHMRELVRRASTPFFVSTMVLVGGTLLAERILAALAWMWNVSPPLLGELLPPGLSGHQVVGILAAAWVGVPLAVYEAWAYLRPGLYPSEQKLVQPGIRALVSIMLAFPLTTAMTLALTRLLQHRLLGLIQKGDSLLLASRAALAISLLALTFSGLRPLLRKLASDARGQYLLLLSEGRLVRRGRTTAALLRRSLVITAIAGAVGLLTAPFYLTASLLLGFIVVCGLVASLLWYWMKQLVEHGSRDRGLDFQKGILALFSNVMYWPAFALILALLPERVERTLSNALLPDVFLDESLIPSLWRLCVVSFLLASCFSLFLALLHADMRRSRQRLFIVVGVAAGLLILVGFSLSLSAYDELLLRVSDVFRKNAALRMWCDWQIAIVTSGIMVLFLFFLPSGPVSLRTRCGLMLQAALAGCIPPLVFVSTAAWPGVLLALAVPASVDFVVKNGLAETRRQLANFFDEFRKTSRELRAALRAAGYTR